MSHCQCQAVSCWTKKCARRAFAPAARRSARAMGHPGLPAAVARGAFRGRADALWRPPAAPHAKPSPSLCRPESLAARPRPACPPQAGALPVFEAAILWLGQGDVVATRAQLCLSRLLLGAVEPDSSRPSTQASSAAGPGTGAPGPARPPAAAASAKALAVGARASGQSGAKGAGQAAAQKAR
jgi:hypothetical protein